MSLMDTRGAVGIPDASCTQPEGNDPIGPSRPVGLGAGVAAALGLAVGEGLAVGVAPHLAATRRRVTARPVLASHTRCAGTAAGYDGRNTARRSRSQRPLLDARPW